MNKFTQSVAFKNMTFRDRKARFPKSRRTYAGQAPSHSKIRDAKEGTQDACSVKYLGYEKHGRREEKEDAEGPDDNEGQAPDLA